MAILIIKKYVLSLIIINLFLSHTACSETMVDYQSQRELMVEEQIINRGIKSPELLKALSTVKRHLFVPKSYRAFSYYDQPLPIGFNQTISQPYIVAIMTELLKLKTDDKVLEIGTGSGYQAAVLAEIADSVFTIEILESLAIRSKNLLDSLGYKNIKVKHGDGYIGWVEHAPFNAIIVTAAPPYIPQPLIEQLAEGGRMVIPVGEQYQELQLLIKTNGKITSEKIIPVRFVPMTGKAQEK